MSLLKALERIAKRWLVLAVAALLRPRAKALRSGDVRRLLLVRIDARVGEALLTTPLLEALAATDSAREVDLLVHSRVLRVLEGHPKARRIIGFDRRRLWLGPWAPGIRALRGEGYDLVVDCGNWTEPAVTSAIISRLIAEKKPSIGPQVWPTRLLHTHSVVPLEGTRSEWKQRLHLLSPLLEQMPAAQLSFRTIRKEPAVTQFLEANAAKALAVVNPGGRLGWRRIPPETFAAAGNALIELGVTPVLTWGPGEEMLAQRVRDEVPGALLAPATGIDGLAQLMRSALLTVCNNTGPMHLSVALGVPTLALFLRMDVKRWGHEAAPHRMLDLTPEFESGSPPEPRVSEAIRAFVGALRGARG